MTRGFLYLIAVLVTVMFLVPFLWMLKTSLQTMRALNTVPPVLIPRQFYFESYVEGLTDYMPFGRFFLNTVTLSGLILIGHLLSSTLVAYPFARLRFPGKRLIFFVLLSTLMLPHSITLVPLYVIFAKLKWINTYLPLAVPAFLGWPFFIFLMRQFMMGIPEDLCEAARIDGLSEPGIWLKIIVPLCTPGLLTVALFSIIGSWGDFMRPLIYLRDTIKFTIALGLQMMSSPDMYIPWNNIMAVSVLSTLPPMLIFLLFQRYFTQGITFSGIKG
jgi:multiple sugar transport system permease protein